MHGFSDGRGANPQPELGRRINKGCFQKRNSLLKSVIPIGIIKSIVIKKTAINN